MYKVKLGQSFHWVLFEWDVGGLVALTLHASL